MSWYQEEILERLKLRKSVLSSSPSEGGSCTSEIKHDRRTAPRPKLFVSKRRLQEQRPQPQKSVLGSSPGENVFVAWKLSTIEEWRLDKFVRFEEDITWTKVHLSTHPSYGATARVGPWPPLTSASKHFYFGRSVSNWTKVTNQKYVLI
jgi:hypothetical protein